MLASVEIFMISRYGMWLQVNKHEFFLPYDEYPWFTKATLAQIYEVQLLHGHHLHWPALDVDLDVEALKNPAAYPLRFS
jgi:hypothetical protein